MNQRIKELMLEAGYAAPEIALRAQKLAELIVRECARVAIQKQTENDIDGIVSNNPAKDFAYALIEHLGVKK
jgi:hypothetical protein